MSEPSTILAIAAHPGDAVFAMGAAVGQHIHNGGRGVLLSLTLGERGHATISPAEYGARQRAATEKAARILRAEAAFLSYPDGELPLNDEAALAVCDLIREHKPAIILTHWSGSGHKDHQNCHGIARDAIFFAGLKALERARPAHSVGRLYFAENWEDLSGFEPDTYLEITPVFERWIVACAAFPMWRGETGFRYSDYYRSLAAMRGCLGGFQHAVALMSSPEQRQRSVKAL